MFLSPDPPFRVPFSNSWDTVSVEYTSISKEVDEFVFTHQVRAGGRQTKLLFFRVPCCLPPPRHLVSL